MENISVLSPSEQEEYLALLQAEAGPIELAIPFTSDWDFLTKACYTRDEASGRVRLFPSYEYLLYIASERTKHTIFAIDKPRRMLISWIFTAIYLYDALSHQHHANYIASQTLSDSSELVGRCEFIYDNIPRDKWPNIPEIKKYAGPQGQGVQRIEIPSLDSRIVAVAEGRDQMRGLGATNVFLDEFAFWRKAEESWTALKPTIQGGGHIDMVSTAELGAFMYGLIYGDGE